MTWLHIKFATLFLAALTLGILEMNDRAAADVTYATSHR